MLKFIKHKLFKKITIIFLFLFIDLIGICGLILFPEHASNYALPYWQLLLFKLLTFLLYLALAYLSYRNVKIAHWLLAVIINLSGIHSVLLGIYRFETYQYFAKSMYISIGVYFFCGSIFFILRNKKRTVTAP